jgi:hypothetical protein
MAEIGRTRSFGDVGLNVRFARKRTVIYGHGLCGLTMKKLTEREMVRRAEPCSRTEFESQFLAVAHGRDAPLVRWI